MMSANIQMSKKVYSYIGYFENLTYRFIDVIVANREAIFKKSVIKLSNCNSKLAKSTSAFLYFSLTFFHDLVIGMLKKKLHYKWGDSMVRVFSLRFRRDETEPHL